MRILAATAFLCVALTSPMTAQGSVWVVDALNLPGTNFTDIQPAVDAAAEGDVVLVRGRFGHQYGNFTVVSKSLLIAGEHDNLSPFPVLSRPVTGAVWIQDLAPTQRVTLRGFSIRDDDPAVPVFRSNLTVTACAGTVFVEDVSMERSSGQFVGQPVPPALNVSTSSAVTLVRCSLRGSNGMDASFGGPGALVFNSDVIMHHVQVVGGVGSPVTSPGPVAFPFATVGGEGMRVIGSSLFTSGCRIEGGAGGLGFEGAFMNCFQSAGGGTGVVLTFNAINSASMVQLDTVVRGGLGGVAPGANCPAGIDADDFELQGSLSVIPAAAYEFHATSPAREGQQVNLHFEARPGDLVLLLAGAFGDPLFDPISFDGLLHIVPITNVRTIGVVPPSGAIDLQVPVAELGIGVDAISIDLQAIYISQALFTLQSGGGDPSSVLLLDRSF